MFGFDWVEEKLPVPYLTLPPTVGTWNLELVVLDLSLSLSLIIRPTTPPRYEKGLRHHRYDVLGCDSIVQRTGY